MKDDSPLTAKWVGENMKLIHFLLKKKNICESWYPNYQDKVQDVLCAILLNVDNYDATRGSKSTYLERLIWWELCKPKKANEKLADSTEQLQDWHDITVECSAEEQIYAEQEFLKLNTVQQMEALGYTFKEIGKVVGLSPDYIRNKKGLATRGKV